MTAAQPSTFPLFSSLAPELRDQIWRYALPEEATRPALFLYKKGCWCCRGIAPDLILEFCHDFLDPLPFDLPLILVNYEARRVAAAWLHKQRGRIIPQPNVDGSMPRFARRFNPTLDIYIQPSLWPDFLVEAIDQIGLPDLADHTVCFESSITRLALPKATILSDLAALPEVWLSFTLVDTLYIILNEPPTSLPLNRDLQEESFQWAGLGAQESAYVWKKETSRFLQIRERGRLSSSDESIYTVFEGLGEPNRVLARALSTYGIGSFIVQPTLAVKR